MSKSKQNANYQEIPRHLQRREPFRGHTMTADWMRGFDIHHDRHARRLVEKELDLYSIDPDRYYYVVWSYDLPIAIAHPHYGVIRNDDTFSKTTTRHQNLVRAWLKE